MKAYNETQEENEPLLYMCKHMAAALFFQMCAKERLESSFSIFFLSKKKKSIFLTIHKKICLNPNLPQDSNVLFFKCHYLQEKMLFKIRKQSLYCPTTQFFGSVFAKTILVMHSHSLQFLVIPFVSRGNH